MIQLQEWNETRDVLIYLCRREWVGLPLKEIASILGIAATTTVSMACARVKAKSAQHSACRTKLLKLVKYRGCKTNCVAGYLIQGELEELYGVEVSPGLISNVIPPLFGFIADRTESYQMAWLAMAALIVLPLVLLFRIEE